MDPFHAVNQLLAISREIFEAFDCNPSLEVRSVFLDISKAFDKVWHEGLLYKIKSMGISGELYSLLESYLSGRLQRVVLNGQTSSWGPVLAGVINDIIRNSETISTFKNILLSFVRPVQNNIFHIFDPIRLKSFTRLRLGFSNLNEHRPRHNF